ncbi:AF10 [Fasciola gigantica]|uniref:AF10 n=1 Tax=Fasciola gigantica TaxID=46835 RepID=A0A504WWA6_FASGI|nr:AF10 [Fasciola gigantica]
MGDPCAVCGLGFHNLSNRLLSCGNCSLAVHQGRLSSLVEKESLGCYGVQKSAGVANWFCRKCESQVRMSKIRCDLCPIKEGAFKRSSGARCWAHLLCAFYIPEVSFEDPVSMDLILLENVPSDRFGRKFATDHQSNDVINTIVPTESSHTENSLDHTTDQSSESNDTHTVLNSVATSQPRRTLPHRTARYGNNSAMHSASSSTSDLVMQDADETEPVSDSHAESGEETGDTKPTLINATKTRAQTITNRSSTPDSSHGSGRDRVTSNETFTKRTKEKSHSANGKDKSTLFSTSSPIPSPDRTVKRDASPVDEKLDSVTPGLGDNLMTTQCSDLTDVASSPCLHAKEVNRTVTANDPPVTPTSQPPKLDLAPISDVPTATSNSLNERRRADTADCNRPDETGAVWLRVTATAPEAMETENTPPTSSDLIGPGQKRHALFFIILYSVCSPCADSKASNSGLGADTAVGPITTATSEISMHSQANLPLILPRRPLSLRGLGLPCSSKNNTVLGPIAAHHITGSHSPKVPGERGSSQPPLATMHDLLEWQWDQAGALLLQQAEGTDVVSLLDCLHQLKSENDILEAKVVRLQTRREHLRSVNARLSASLATMEATRMTSSPPPTSSFSVGYNGVTTLGATSHISSNSDVRLPIPSLPSQQSAVTDRVMPICVNESFMRPTETNNFGYSHVSGTQLTALATTAASSTLPPPTLSPNRPCPKHTVTSPYHHHHHRHHHQPQHSQALVKQLPLPPTSEPNTSALHARGPYLAPTDGPCQPTSGSTNLTSSWRPIAPAPDPDQPHMQSRQQQLFNVQPGGIGADEVNSPGTNSAWSGRFLQPGNDGMMTTMLLTSTVSEGTANASSGTVATTMACYNSSSLPITVASSHQNEGSLRAPGKRIHSTHTSRTSKHSSSRRWPLFQPTHEADVQMDSSTTTIGRVAGEPGLSRPTVDLSDLQELSARLSSAIAARRPLNNKVSLGTTEPTHMSTNSMRSAQGTAGMHRSASRSLISHIPNIQPKPVATQLPPTYSAWTVTESKVTKPQTDLPKLHNSSSCAVTLLAAAPITVAATPESRLFSPGTPRPLCDHSDRLCSTSFDSNITSSQTASISRTVDADCRSTGSSYYIETSGTNPNTYTGSGAAAAYLVLTPSASSANVTHGACSSTGQSLPSAGTLLDRSACPPSQ